MSVNQPPPIGGGPPTAAPQPTAQAPLPGASLNAAAPQAAGLKLLQLFGQSLVEWGQAVLKQDTRAVAIAQRKVQQVTQAGQAQGKPQSRPAPVQPRTGVPTPVGTSSDALTGR